MEIKVPKKTYFLWLIRAVILLFFAVITAFFISPFSFLLIAAAILSALFYLFLYFKNFRLFIGESTLEIKKGVFIKSTSLFPFSRFVYVRAYITPLSEKTGLCALVLKGVKVRIILPELEREKTELLYEV